MSIPFAVYKLGEISDLKPVSDRLQSTVKNIGGLETIQSTLLSSSKFLHASFLCHLLHAFVQLTANVTI